MRLNKDTESECVTTEGGGRFAVAVGGSFTGRGADVIIIDDPMKADDAQSEKARRAVNEWYGSTLVSRLDDKEQGAIILVMQRLHEDDLAGKLLREGLGAISICRQLPKMTRRSYRPWRDPSDGRKARSCIPHASLERPRGDQARNGLACLFGPIPATAGPLEGNLIKCDGSNGTTTPPSRDPGAEIVHSWDVASTTGETNDWSVCTTG